MSQTRVSYEALPHQSRLWLANQRHVALFGGVGAGKTDFNSIWSIKKIKEAAEWPQDKAQGIIAANTYPQLIDSTLRNIFGNWRRFGVRFRPNDIPRNFSPLTVQVWQGGQWRDILCRSLNHPDTIRGTEVGWAIIDETAGTSKDAVDVINSRVRATDQPNNQILYTSTVDDPTHWMYAMFVESFDPDQMHVEYATSYDNPHLPVDFIEGLKATYSEQQFRREVMAQWVSLAEGLIYYAFDRGIHVDEAAEFDEVLPTYWTHDFNIGEGKPMSSILFQLHNGRHDGRLRKEIHVFDEIVIDTADTNDVIQEWYSRYADRIVHDTVTICGDAAGRSRDTRSKTSDYGLLRDGGFPVQDVPLSNPPIRTRHNRCNAMLKSASGDVRVRIHPRCKTLIRGLETVRVKPGANYIELETREQHVTTAFGYGVMACFPEETRRTSTAAPMVRAV